ncbi:MAG: hypothetical protein CEN90_383 [Parcubacteria group bacterium Licking1014_17]|nr:MAG: hypothetical protein CEN90_383 [Parcubacteria group bacterium Licking1014_17]
MKKILLEGKNIQELNGMLMETRKKLGRFKFQSANRPLNDNSQFGKTRKEIARIMTAIGNINKKTVK